MGASRSSASTARASGERRTGGVDMVKGLIVASSLVKKRLRSGWGAPGERGRAEGGLVQDGDVHRPTATRVAGAHQGVVAGHDVVGRVRQLLQPVIAPQHLGEVVHGGER